MAAEKRPDDDVNWGALAAVGLQVAVGVALGYGVGWWLDRRFGWAPWGAVVGSMLGLASGLYLLMKDVARLNRDDEAKPRKPGTHDDQKRP